MRIIAHRSGPGTYPEQTVKSAFLALSNGADMVEIDIRISKDGVPVISHDETLMRLFGKIKKISSVTAEKYSSLRRKDYPEFTGHTYRDYINRGVSPLLLHIKESEKVLPEILKKIETISGFENITFGVSTPEAVSIVKQYNPAIPVLAFMSRKEMLDDCIKAGADYIRLWQGWMTDELVEYIHSHGREVWIMVGGCSGFDVGETDEVFILKAIKSGVDGILINDITKLKKFV